MSSNKFLHNITVTQKISKENNDKHNTISCVIRIQKVAINR